ncbi:zinc-binding dehydrogenase [Natrinema saccharevitans]|nr:zinc-binding dehydrogenase [Natrinema saccharevitans]
MIGRGVELVENGTLEPVVHERYSLAEADRAFADMADRNAVGKLVVEP